MMGGTIKSAAFAAAGVVGLASAGAAFAQNAPIPIEDTGLLLAESVTSTAAGDIIIGSIGKGHIYKAAAGEQTAKIWIPSEKTGAKALLGVYAWEPTNTLYACARATEGEPDSASALKTFDLTTGAAKQSYPLPGGAKELCNDIAVGPNGDVYVAETLGGQILRLKKDGTALEGWVKTDDLASADGVAIGQDGAVYLNTVRTNRMFKVAVNADGSAGAVTELKPSEPLKGPDGLRSLPDGRFIQAESGTGRLAVITVSGDQAKITQVGPTEIGIVSTTYARGKVWSLNAKFAYRNEPELKDKDPGVYDVKPYDMPAK